MLTGLGHNQALAILCKASHISMLAMVCEYINYRKRSQDLINLFHSFKYVREIIGL